MENLMVFLYFFFLFVQPKRLIIPNEKEHLLKQWLNIFLFNLAEAEVAGIVVYITYPMYSQPIPSYILSIIVWFHSQIGSTNVQCMLNYMSTAGSSVRLWTWKVFCCSTSWMLRSKHLLCWTEFIQEVILSTNITCIVFHVLVNACAALQLTDSPTISHGKVG